MDGDKNMRILLFTGDGKGKTTAALGIALRAAGHGMKSLMVQFIKSNAETGEVLFSKSIEKLEIIQTGRGFVPDSNSADYKNHRQNAQAGLSRAQKALVSGKYPVVILDEICVAIDKQLLDEQDVLNAIKDACQETVIVMTGRKASSGLIDIADTVTEMQCVKHGYKLNILAQQGVEF